MQRVEIHSMTAFPVIGLPYGFRRILSVNVRQRMRADLKLERELVAGHVQHTFEIPWLYLSAGDRTTLAAWFVSCRGRITADIEFTDPYDSVVYTCRLDADQLDIMAPTPVPWHWTATIRLIECGDWKALKAAVDTFPPSVPAQPPYRTSRLYRTVIETAPDGTEKRFEDMASSVQRWSAGGDVLTSAQVGALLDCWEGNLGPWSAFAFTDAEAGAHASCHFADPTITHTIMTRNAAGYVHSLRVTVEELK